MGKKERKKRGKKEPEAGENKEKKAMNLAYHT